MTGVEILSLIAFVLAGLGAVTGVLALIAAFRLGGRLDLAEQRVRILTADVERVERTVRDQWTINADLHRDAKQLRDHLGVERVEVKATTQLVPKAKS